MTGAMVDVVLPCLNESGALPWVLSRIPEGYRAIVVDNGSTDGSPEIAKSLGALVVHETRRGFGAAAHAGLRAATAEIVAFCDCDGSLDPRGLPGLVAPLLGGTADLVLGSRQPQRGSWPLHARLANIVLARRLRSLTGLPVTDLGPMRAARRTELLSLGLEDRRSGYPLEMFLKAHLRGWQILEIPVPYAPRTGKSKVTGTLRGTITAVRDMSAQLKSAAAAAYSAPVPGAGGSE
jgi:glycosyltransferase involved in cell wall biosynthesis